MVRAVVLDSWAIVAMLEGAAAASAVHAEVEAGACSISAINLGETHYIAIRRVGDDAAIRMTRALESRVGVVAASRDLVLAAARIKARGRMSYADSFAAATAVKLDAELWTGDPELLVAGAPWRWRDLRAG